MSLFWADSLVVTLAFLFPLPSSFPSLLLLFPPPPSSPPSPLPLLLPLLPHAHMQHLPLLIIVIAITLACIKVVPFTFAWLAVMGTLTSWIYLRFYQKKEQDSRGDMSEGFAFATFFPEPIQ